MDDKNKKALGIGLGALALLGLGIGLSKMRGGGTGHTCSATQYWNGSACVDKPVDSEPLVCAPGWHPNATNTACEKDIVAGNNTESGLPIVMNIKRVTTAYGNIIPKQIDIGETFYGWIYLLNNNVYALGDGYQNPRKNEWDFGDGTIVDLTKGGSGVHTYAEYGAYVIKNTFEDAGGNTGFISREIILTKDGIAGTIGYIGDGGFSNIQRWNKDTGAWEDLPILTGFRYRSKQLTGTHVIGHVEATTPPWTANNGDRYPTFVPYSETINIFVPWNDSKDGWCDWFNSAYQEGCRRPIFGITPDPLYIAANAHDVLSAAYPDLVYHDKFMRGTYDEPVSPPNSLETCFYNTCPLGLICIRIEGQSWRWNYQPQGVVWQEI